MRGAINRLFELQRCEPSRTAFTADDLCVEDEDGGDSAVIAHVLAELAELGPPASPAVAGLLSRTVRSGRKLAAVGEELKVTTAELRQRSEDLAGGAFIPFATRLATAIAVGPEVSGDSWSAIEKKIGDFEKHGWTIQTAVGLLRAQVRSRFETFPLE